MTSAIENEIKRVQFAEIVYTRPLSAPQIIISRGIINTELKIMYRVVLCWCAQRSTIDLSWNPEQPEYVRGHRPFSLLQIIPLFFCIKSSRPVLLERLFIFN